MFVSPNGIGYHAEPLEQLNEADLDLEQEMHWEDQVQFVSLEVVEPDLRPAPQFGYAHAGVCEYVSWWSDGEDSRYCDN